jgi:hypothetical protein
VLGKHGMWGVHRGWACCWWGCPCCFGVVGEGGESFVIVWLNLHTLFHKAAKVTSFHVNTLGPPGTMYKYRRAMRT